MIVDLANKKILIVEDENICRENIERVLKKEGYWVKSVENGKIAIELVQKELFDLIITDLKMEEIDGMEVLREAKRCNPETEVIIITGYATVDSAVKAMRDGAYYYIAKPFKLEVLKEIVKEALLRRIAKSLSHTS